MTISEMQQMVHALSVEKGWWDGVEPYTGHYQPTVDQVGMRIALIHSEGSEALEDVRTGDMVTVQDIETGKLSGFPTELADIVIRAMDLAGGMGIDLEAEIRRKHAFNKTRPYRHGGKLA